MIREFLKDLMGRSSADPEPEFLGGMPPLPIEDQNAIVNYALFTVGMLVSCIGLAECCWPLAVIGGVALGIFTRRAVK
ncbi:MAG: hypothetical protein ABIH46_10770 [Chloroflexota bacterium]